jgi:magnesium transporter
VASVSVHETLDELEDFFDRHDYAAAPVVDEQGRLVGVLPKSEFREALGFRADKQLMRFGGIVGGEELRTLPASTRALRRGVFLLATLLLTLVSISVIGFFESTIEAAPALAMFLPLVAGLCGASGNQAVAVSIREMSLGLIRPSDAIRVARLELGVGLVIGAGLGLAVFAAAWAYRGDAAVAAAVGLSIPSTIVVSTCVGGVVPLWLKGMGLDAAMASGPLITTIVDLSGFLAVLALAAALVGAAV